MAVQGAGRSVRTVAALAAALLLAVAGEAAANTALCRNLERQLTSVGQPSGNQARRYDKAIAEQSRQIGNVRAQLSDMGCGFFALRAECAAARDTLRRMESNLAELRSTRERMGAGGSRREQARILAALNENGCRAPGRRATQEAAASRRDHTLFDRLFGRNPQRDTYSQDPDTFSDGSAETGTRWAGGSYRTLCVRTCDGYYFPISYSSSAADFDRDAKACAAMCPGTDTVLFHHRVPHQESEEMVSAATGMPYTDLPRAFEYRKLGYVRAPSCGCGTPKAFTVIAGQAEEPSEPESVAAVVPRPLQRPDVAEDPETAANRVAGLSVAALKSMLSPPESASMPVSSIAP